MSTLGGSRGERNAKPKFSALDINSLYRTSRGEPLEQAKQNNTVPRKHGMQTLGKVPSARRPPANLPSIKAEASDPTGTWPATAAPATTSSNATNPQNLDKQHSGEQANQQNSTVKSSGSLNNNNNNNNNNNSSATWTAPKPKQEPAPKKQQLYQSPQFQHEFPSLDGSIAQAQSKGNRGSAKSNQSDSQHTGHHSHSHTNTINNNQNAAANAGDAHAGADSNRTQNNAHTDQPHTSSSSPPSNEKGNAAIPAAQQVLPPQFKALMPQFMHRLKGFDNIAPEDPNAGAQPHHGPPHRDNNNRHSGRDHQYHNRNRDRDRDRNDDRYRRGPRQRQEPTYDDYDMSFQGIIKEEEMERFDQITKGEGWNMDDEIDYNQKLSFSDDDSDTPLPTKETKSKENKRVNFNDRNKEARAEQERREKELQLQQQREAAEKERIEREQIERNEREKNDGNRPNGHRGGAPVLDADVLERVKQRKEEEEKRAYDRRMAAHKKLQELEQKLGKKKDGEPDVEQSSPPTSSSYAKDGADSRKTNDRYMGRDEARSDARDYSNRYDRDSKYDREMGSRDRGTAGANDYYNNKPYQSNLPPRFQKQRDQHDNKFDNKFENKFDNRHPTYKNEPPHRNLPRDHMRRPNQSQPQNYIGKGRRDMPRRETQSISSEVATCDSDEEHVSSGRESISRSSAGERPTILTRSTSDSSQAEFKEKIGSWADEVDPEYKPPQRQISSTSTASNNDDNQPKQILQRARKVSVDSRSDKEKSEEREVVQDDASKLFGTSPIEAPRSWADSSPTTPEITVRKSTESLTEPSPTSTKSVVESDKKPLEKVEENEPANVSIEESKAKAEEKTPSEKQGNRSFSSTHSKDQYSSDDGKHGNISKRPNNRNMRHENARVPSSRNYGQSYRGQPNNWNNRHGRQNRFNEYSESEGSDDDEYHNRGNRGKDDRYRQSDSSNKRDSQPPHKEVFVPRGEPSRRGRGGGRTASGPVLKRIDNYGPPNARSPFGSSDDKPEKSTEAKVEDPTKKTDSSAPQLDSASPIKPVEVKTDDKNIPGKPAFSDVHKESADHKTESQSFAKVDEAPNAIAPPGHRTEKPNQSSPQTDNKQHSGYSGGNQSSASGKIDKNLGGKKDDYSHARSSAPNMNRGKPQTNMPASAKPQQQSAPAKPVSSKPAANINQPMQPQPNVIGNRQPQQHHHQQHQQQPPPQQQQQQQQQLQQQQLQQQLQQPQQQQQQQQQQQPGGNMAPRFVKQPRNRNSSTSSNTWDKANVDMPHVGDTHENDFGQRANPLDKIGHEMVNKPDATTKIASTMIFENTNFKQMPGPINRQPGPPNLQQGPNQQQRNNQYDQVQANNLGGHHVHHPQQPQHHMDKKAEDVFKTANSGGNFQDMLDSQQQLQQQVQRNHQSQTESISSALHNMSFQKTDAEYEKDLKLAFTFENEMPLLTEDKNTKGGLCIPPARSSTIHSAPTSQNTISPSIADLSKKIGSVKKVWESVGLQSVNEHVSTPTGSGGNDDGHLSASFASTQSQQHMHQFTHAQQQLHQSGLGSYGNSFGGDASGLDHFAKAGGPDSDIGNDVGYNPNPQHVVGGNNAHANPNMKHNDPLATVNVCKVKPNPQMHPSGLGLSPPPMQQGMQAAPQPYYQPSQFGGISAIPSPPAVLYNSTPMPSQGNIYGHYERYITSAHYGATGNTAPYANAPYMPNAPNMQAAPAPDMYQNMTSQFRMGGAVQPAYNQQQPMNNQNTVLISSTSNSLMSASVKPSSQQIGAIGTKVNAGQTPYGHQQPWYQPPPQNNGYYSNSAAGQGAFFGTPGANYGIFGAPQAQPPSNASISQQPVANYNFLAVNRQYQGQQNTGYSQQQSASRNSQNQPNSNQSQQQSQSVQQSQQSNNNSQNPAVQQQSHGAQDSVSNSFFK